jgi:hypothetical protein
MAKDSWKWWAGLAGVATLVGAIALWPKKKLAAQSTSVDFEAGGSRPVTMRVGDQLTVNLPPGHTYNMAPFVGAETVVGVRRTPANASTGYSSFTMTAVAPGNAQAVIDTGGDTQPMTLQFGVA